MPLHYFVAALGFAAIDWIAGVGNELRLTYVARPAMILSLLVWLAQIGTLRLGMGWFAAGLVFILIGDTLLMLPGSRRHAAGLTGFVLAHLAFTIGLNTPTLPPQTGAAGILSLFVGATIWQIDGRILPAITNSELRRLRLPALLYSIVISLMLLSALLTLTRPDWAITSAVVVSSGALLMFFSDVMWAWNKFLAPLPQGRLRIHVTFHLGMALLVLGAGLRFLFPL